MASISKFRNGRKRIQFIDDDRKRPCIRLGICDASAANTVKRHVERILTARRTNTKIPPSTAKWLKGISSTMRCRMARAGLGAPPLHATGHRSYNELTDSHVGIDR